MKHQAQSWINLSLDVSQTAFTSKDPVSFLFPHASCFFFLFWGCLDFFGIEFVLYLWVLLFAFLSKIVMWLHGMHKFFFEPCRMGGEELWRFGKSQPMHWSERLWAEKNGSRICALLKQALMPSFFTVWIQSELTDRLIHYFYCIWIRAGILLNPDIWQMSCNENPRQVVQHAWHMVPWKV